MEVRCVAMMFKERGDEKLFLSLPKFFTHRIVQTMIDKYETLDKTGITEALRQTNCSMGANYEDRYFTIKYACIYNNAKVAFGIDLWEEVTLDEHLDYLNEHKDREDNLYEYKKD